MDMGATNAAAPTTMREDDKPGEFTIPVERQQQIGVTYATVQKQPFTQTVRGMKRGASEQIAPVPTRRFRCAAPKPGSASCP